MVMVLMGRRWPRQKSSAASGVRLAERRCLPVSPLKKVHSGAVTASDRLSQPKSGSLSAVAGCREGPLFGVNCWPLERGLPENVNNEQEKTVDAGQTPTETPANTCQNSREHCPSTAPSSPTHCIPGRPTNVAGTIRIFAAVSFPLTTSLDIFFLGLTSRSVTPVAIGFANSSFLPDQPFFGFPSLSLFLPLSQIPTSCFPAHWVSLAFFYLLLLSCLLVLSTHNYLAG